LKHKALARNGVRCIFDTSNEYRSLQRSDSPEALAFCGFADKKAQCGAKVLGERLLKSKLLAKNY